MNFIWRLTPEGYEKIRHNAMEPDVFGAVHLGRILVEFRCNGGGFDAQNHDCVTDVFVYGEEDELNDLWMGDTPYHWLDEDIVIPHRRTIEGFKRAFENEVRKFLKEYPDLVRFADCETVVDPWY